MTKRRISYATIWEMIKNRCPEEFSSAIWRMYRHGYTGLAPIGKNTPNNGTRLFINGGYFKEGALDRLREQIDLGWEVSETFRVSFDVMKLRQWMPLEEVTAMCFYKLKLNAIEDKKGRTMLESGRIEPYRR
jgi:hypothetical protein